MRYHYFGRRYSAVISLAALLSAVLLPCAPLRAAIPKEELDRELKFADGLIMLGFPDFAEKVMEEVKRRDPTASGHLKAVRVKSLAFTRQFDEAEQLLSLLPAGEYETWVARLSYADICFAIGEFPRMLPQYKAFFKKYSEGAPKGREDEFKGLAYRYSQMVRYIGDAEGTLQAYEQVLKAGPSREEELQIWTEMAELCLKLGAASDDQAKRDAYFERAKKYAIEVQWRGMTLWFGRTIVVLAHIEMAKGDKEAARAIIQDKTNYQMLLQLDEQVRDDPEFKKLSPMAECRYLLGSLHDEDGDDALAAADEDKATLHYKAAIKHLYNVFLKYPTTTWAAEAGMRSHRIIDKLARLGIRVQLPKLKGMDEIMNIQFRESGILFKQQDYKGAIDKYLAVLSLFPEEARSPTALGELAQCYYMTENPLWGRMVVGHLAERFPQNAKLRDPAGGALLGVAMNRKDVGDMDSADEIYRLYFSNYKEHSRYGDIVLYFGDQKLREEAYAEAATYYMLIEPSARQYLGAQSKLALSYSKQGLYTNEIAVLETYIAALKPSPDMASATYRLGRAYMEEGDLIRASKNFVKLGKWLEDTTTDSPYQETQEDIEKNVKIRESALFSKATCFAKIAAPTNKVGQFQLLAVKNFEDFVTQYPESDLAPKALASAGVVRLIRGEADEAARLYERLQNEYPGSEESRGAQFAQYRALMELGFVDRALKVVQRMLQEPDALTPPQFLAIGKSLLDEGQNDMALRVLETARKQAGDGLKPGATAKQKTLTQGLLFSIGEAYYRLAEHERAIGAFEELFKHFERTGYTVRACFMLAEAYAERGKAEVNETRRVEIFNQAMDTMKRASKLCRQPEQRARVDVQLAKIYELKGAPKDAAASFMRLFLLADDRNPKVRPYMQEAFGSLVPILFEMARSDDGRWMDVYDMSDRYLKLFPEGEFKGKARNWRSKARVELGDQAPPMTGGNDDTASDDAAAPDEPDPATEASLPEETATP